MFSKAASYCFTATKVYGLSTISNEVLLGLMGGVDAEFIPLAYSLAIEGLFIFMKSYHIAFPQWMETMQDLF